MLPQIQEKNVGLGDLCSHLAQIWKDTRRKAVGRETPCV